MSSKNQTAKPTFGMAHRQKGIFCGWAFGRGIPVWHSELDLLPKNSYFDRIMAAPIPEARDSIEFASNEEGWRSGFLLERFPDDIFVFKIPADLIGKPKSQSLSLLWSLLNEE